MQFSSQPRPRHSPTSAYSPSGNPEEVAVGDRLDAEAPPSSLRVIYAGIRLFGELVETTLAHMSRPCMKFSFEIANRKDDDLWSAEEILDRMAPGRFDLGILFLNNLCNSAGNRERAIFQLVTTLRSECDLRIIGLTGHPPCAEPALEAGAAAVFYTPVSMKALKRELPRILGWR